MPKEHLRQWEGPSLRLWWMKWHPPTKKILTAVLQPARGAHGGREAHPRWGDPLNPLKVNISLSLHELPAEQLQARSRLWQGEKLLLLSYAQPTDFNVNAFKQNFRRYSFYLRSSSYSQLPSWLKQTVSHLGKVCIWSIVVCVCVLGFVITSMNVWHEKITSYKPWTIWQKVKSFRYRRS